MRYAIGKIIFCSLTIFALMGCAGEKNTTEPLSTAPKVQEVTQQPSLQTKETSIKDATWDSIDSLEAKEPSDKLETEWLALLINNQKSGHLFAARLVETDNVTTQVRILMAMKRGPIEIKIETVTETVETLDGKPLSFRSMTKGTGMTQKKWGAMGEDNKFYVTTKTVGPARTTTIDWPEGALMPEGQRLEMIAKGLKEGTSYSTKHFDAELTEVLDVDIKVGANQSLDLLGRVVSATRVDVTMKTGVGSIESVVYTNENMDTLKTVISMMGTQAVMIACPKEYALSDNDPAEIFVSGLLKSPSPLSMKKRKGKLTYKIKSKETDKEINFVTTSEQAAAAGQSKDSWTVVVENIKMPSGVSFPYTGSDPQAIEALKPNNWLQSDSKEIIELAKNATKGAKDAAQAAKKIENFVDQYIDEKSLSVGYATALEVARSRQGDCSEHAVLAAAMCQAVGIPAKVATGVLYVEEFGGQKNIFGGHAWTQVYLDGKWISIDAAAGGFDAGHITLKAGDGNPSKFFELMSTMGQFDITSVE